MKDQDFTFLSPLPKQGMLHWKTSLQSAYKSMELKPVFKSYYSVLLESVSWCLLLGGRQWFLDQTHCQENYVIEMTTCFYKLCY